jgi:hypothetical protein
MRASLGFIEELCIALEHEWKPSGLFVIFTGYFDEADTHGPSPTVIMAGFLGHAYQWRIFEKKLGRIQRRDNFRIFHGKDFKAHAGEFVGWDDDKDIRLLNDLTDLVKDELTEGLTVALERARYENEYRAEPFPKKMHRDSQYGVCFRACMSHLLDLMSARGNRDRLHIVIERGHPNVFDCERIFNDLKIRLRRIGIDVLGTFTVEKKTDCMPLMVADFLATTYSMMRVAEKAAVFNYKDVAPLPPRNEAGLTFLELREDALKNLKTNFELDRQQQIDKWRQARAARKASSSAAQPS